LADGGGGIVLEPLVSRRVGADPPLRGVKPAQIPRRIRHIIDYDRRVLARARNPRARATIRLKIVRADTVRRVAAVRHGGATMTVWTGRRNDGSERVFISLAAGASRWALDGVACDLTPDAPAVCSVGVGSGPGRGRPGVRLLVGRAAADIVKVQGLTTTGQRPDATVEDGWFLLPTSPATEVKELYAVDAVGMVVGKTVLPPWSGLTVSR
jgi:hypothetical protein